MKEVTEGEEFIYINRKGKIYESNYQEIEIKKDMEENMNNREKSYIGDTGLKIYAKLKNMGKCTHPVGGLIPPKGNPEWEKLRNRFEKYGVNMNKGGLMFIVKWANLHLDASCPVAEKLGYHPVGFTDDQVMICTKSLKDLDISSLIKQSMVLRKNVLDETQDQIKVSIPKKISEVDNILVE